MERTIQEKNIEALAEDVVNEIRRQGADEGQVFVTSGAATTFTLEQGEYKSCSTTFDESINVLVYKDKKKGSYYINRADGGAVKNAVGMALEAANAAEPDEANGIAPDQGEIRVKQGVYEPDLELLFDRMEELRRDISEQHPNLLIDTITAVHNNRHMAYRNTNGTVCDEYVGSYRFDLGIAGKNEDRATNLNYSSVVCDRLDRRIISCGDIERVLAIMEKQPAAVPMEDKFVGTVLLNSGVVEEFIRYLYDIAAKGGRILDGTSVWKDKLGKKVTDERLSIRIDPHDPHVVRGENLTEDGFRSEGYDFIKNGVLENFIMGYYTAKKTGHKRAANLGFNLIIAPGGASREDMIRHIERGIIVDGFSGGQPAVGGDFSGVAKNSFLVENGKITCAVSEAMISGNLFEMFQNIRDISKERICSGWQAVPDISFDGITVSGK